MLSPCIDGSDSGVATAYTGTVPDTPSRSASSRTTRARTPRQNLARAERLVRAAAGTRRADHLPQRAVQLPRTSASRSRAIASTWPSRFPGPTTDAMQALARELEVVIVVPLFERQARRPLPELGRDHRRRRLAARRVSQDAHPRRPAVQREVLLHARRQRPDRTSGPTPSAGGFKVWKTRYATIGVLICWDQWYPEAARITSLLGAQVLFYPTAIGWHPAEKRRMGPGPGRCVADDPARARDRQRRLRRLTQPYRPRGRARHRRHHVLRPFVHRRSVRPLLAEAGEAARRS